jgi:hypothetical protein
VICPVTDLPTVRTVLAAPRLRLRLRLLLLLRSRLRLLVLVVFWRGCRCRWVG